MTETRWTTLPSAVATECPKWASDSTKQLGSEVAEQFAITKRARAEVERLKAEAGTIDVMQTNVCDLIGAAGMARQAMIEALRDELLARSKFAEFLAALESDRRRVERESLERIDQARADGRQRLLDAGVRDLSAAVTSGGRPDETLRNAWGMVLNAYPAVGKAADTYREARSLMPALAERASHNRRHRDETEASLRKMLETMAAAAVA